jgi:hypothetical protein
MLCMQLHMASRVPLDDTVPMRLRGSNKYPGLEPTLGLHPLVGATTYMPGN